MIGNLINKIDKFSGVIFFNNLNPLSYNLFNFFFKKNIMNLKNIENKQYIYNFEKFGYSKLSNFNLTTLNKINTILKDQNPKNNENNRFQYILNNEIINLIKKLITEDCNEILDNMAKYLNSNIYLSHALITRNYNYDMNKGESYSSYFHCDGYLNTYFKILINLSDVTEDMGPIQIINKIDTKKNVGIFKYNSRELEKQKKIKSLIFKNVSNFGDGLLVNTTECLHRAGIPEKNNFRDMMYLIFCAYPENSSDLFHYEKVDKSIWQPYSKLVKKLSKPYGFKNIYKLYKKFLKKIN